MVEIIPTWRFSGGTPVISTESILAMDVLPRLIGKQGTINFDDFSSCSFKTYHIGDVHHFVPVTSGQVEIELEGKLETRRWSAGISSSIKVAVPGYTDIFCLHVIFINVCVYVYIYRYIHMCVYVSVYVYVCMCICVSMYVCMYVCM